MLASPVTAGLVERGELWPGLRTSPRDIIGFTETVNRPGVFFREKGPVPAGVELRVTRPDIGSDLSDDDLATGVASKRCTGSDHRKNNPGADFRA